MSALLNAERSVPGDDIVLAAPVALERAQVDETGLVGVQITAGRDTGQVHAQVRPVGGAQALQPQDQAPARAAQHDGLARCRVLQTVEAARAQDLRARRCRPASRRHRTSTAITGPFRHPRSRSALSSPCRFGPASTQNVSLPAGTHQHGQQHSLQQCLDAVGDSCPRCGLSPRPSSAGPVPGHLPTHRLGLGVGEGEVERLGDLTLGVGHDDAGLFFDRRVPLRIITSHGGAVA